MKFKKLGKSLLYFLGALAIALIWGTGINALSQLVFPQTFFGFTSAAQDAIVGLVLAPIIETLIFVWLPMRVLFHNKFGKKNTLYAMILIAWLFGIYHKNDYYHMMVQGGVGFVFLYTYLKTKSFTVVAALHACYNAAIMILSSR